MMMMVIPTVMMMTVTMMIVAETTSKWETAEKLDQESQQCETVTELYCMRGQLFV